MRYSHYPILAELFYFPDKDYTVKVDQCRKMLEEWYPELLREFDSFRNFVHNMSPSRLAQIYMRTFDIQPLCCMDVGFVLFGEDYTRGKILANLNKEHHKAGIDCRGELADRLPNLLRLLPNLQDSEKLKEMVQYLLKPALHKMIVEFEPARIDKKDEIYQKFHHTVLNKVLQRVTQYRIPLQTVRHVLDIDFPDVKEVNTGMEKDFTESVKNEFKNQQKSTKF